jgi:hypothetical protein
MLRVNLTPIVPNDFWWHLATGRIIAQTWHIPQVDRFSYTQAGQPYFNQPWLAQLLMYGVYSVGGAALLAALQTVLLGCTSLLLYRVCRGTGAGPRIAAIAVLVGMLIGMNNWLIRPQTYALPLFVTTLALLFRWRSRGQAALWALPLLMLAWVNLHGSFPLLLLLCGSFWVGAVCDQWRYKRNGESQQQVRLLAPQEYLRQAIWSSIAALITFVNPAGWRVWQYALDLTGNRAVRELVTEWAPPMRDLHEPMSWIYFGFVVLLLSLIVWRRRWVRCSDLVLLLPFLVLAFQSVRHVLWFGLLAAPIAARLLAAHVRPTQARAEVMLLNRLIAGLLIGLVAATLPWWKEHLDLPGEQSALVDPATPVAAVQQLRTLPQQPQRLFHEMGIGSYLIWALPDQPVFVDPRIELYPYEQWRDYIRLGRGEQIDELTARYGFDGWLVSPTEQSKLLAALDADPRWQRVFSTDEAVLIGPTTNSQHSIDPGR